MAISLDLKFNLQTFANNKATQSFEQLQENPDKIKFFGHSDITQVLPISALQTLTSISEGMPLVILEGFAAGVPCVATDVGSCRDLIEGGLNEEDKKIGLAGAVTGIANPEALAQEYIKFLTFENGVWEQAQKNALTRVQKYYKEDMFLQEYRDIYNEALHLNWAELQKKVFAYYAANKIPYPKLKIKRFTIRKYTKTPKAGEA